MDFGTFAIERLIVHEIPRKTGADSATPILSDMVSPTDGQIRNYFREKLTRTLAGADGYEVRFASPPTSPIPDLITKCLSDASNESVFVAATRAMATHLFNIQNAVNSPGLLTGVQGSIDTIPCVAVLKLEREQGIRATPNSSSGHLTFDIEHLHELFLTGNTRVFKAALFRINPETKEEEGLASDAQRPYRPTVEIADFFLSRFLGCRLREEPKVMTRRIYDATERFINEAVKDPRDQANYQIALMVEMNSNKTHFRAQDFGRETMNTRDSDSYRAALQQQGLPTGSIRKDLGLVAAKLARVQIDFDSGITLFGPRAEMEGRVKVSPKGESAEVSFTDAIKKIHGR